MVNVGADEVGRTFSGGKMMEEGLILPVLPMIRYEVNNVGCNEDPSCAGQHRVDPGQVSDEQLVLVQEKVHISKGGCRVSR